MSKKIVLFENRIDCCGCGACSDICPKNAIKMVDGIGGYRYPQIDCSLCISCGTCLKVCPIKKRKTHDIEQKNKPHIKIVNYGMFNNFGAVIAASCLEKAVRDIVPENYIVQTVNYDSHSEYTNSFREFKKKVKNRIDFLNIIFEKLKLKKEVKTEECTIKHDNENIRYRRYEKFRNNYINLTVKMNNGILDSLEDNDVALICGSDTIWFPNRVFLRSYKGFYLDFGSENTRRISYAPSLDKKMKRGLNKESLIYKRRLKNLDFISVRDKSNLEFVQSLTEKTVQNCVDPVLLFNAEYFKKMSDFSEETAPEEEYIYAYILMHNDSAFEYVKKLAKEKNLKIYYFADYYTDFGENSVNCYSDGPAEFLQKIKNAKYVVTTSFHCIVFSLLFKKQFLAFDRGHDSVKIPDILEMFGVTDRLISGKDISDIDTPIDFEKAGNLIEKYRKSSLEFLKNSLSEI